MAVKTYTYTRFVGGKEYIQKQTHEIKKRVFTEEEINEIIRLSELGVPKNRLMKQFNISFFRLNKLLDA